MAGIINNVLRGFGKAAQGAATVAIPMALEEMKADIMAQRDATLNKYETERQEDQQAHELESTNKAMEQATSERIAGEEFTAGENDKTRGIQRERLNVAKKQLNLIKDESQLSQAIKLIELENTERVSQLQKEYDQTTNPDKRADLERRINIFSGRENDNDILPVEFKDGIGGTVEFKYFDTRTRRYIDEEYSQEEIKKIAEEHDYKIEDLNLTAETHGISVREVIRRLGVPGVK